MIVRHLHKPGKNEIFIDKTLNKNHYKLNMVVNPMWRQILATLAAAASTFGWGCNIGLPTTLISKLRHHEFGLSITDEDASWIGSCLAIGGIFGSLVAGK